MMTKDSKRLEEQPDDDLPERRVDLEKDVAERTAELEAFSYSVAHDMRAPLRAMQSYAQIILDDYSEPLHPTAKQYLGRIVASANRLDHLILDVLHYSKLDRGELELVAVDTGRLLQEVIESYPNLNAPNVKIEIEQPLPVVVGNHSALSQAIANLLSNAVKFVRPGEEPRVRVRGERREDSVRLWFEDNGVGIPLAAQSRVFQLFQRLHAGYEGTGIGLAIVRKAIQRMGGTVGVESEPGKGSRFWIQLPARA